MVIQRVWRSSAASSSLNVPASAAAVAAATVVTSAISPAGTSVATTVATSASETSSTNSNGGAAVSASEPEASAGLHTGMRQKLKNTLSGEATLEALKQRYGTGRSFVSQTANDAAIKSLELLRANIQCYFDKEVDTIVKKFHQTYFVPAIRNIKENLGDGAISDEALKSVFCSLLENTKAQYASQLSSPAGNSLSRANTPGMELSDSDSSTDNSPATGAATSLLHQALKRKLPEPNQPDLFKRQYFLHGPIFPHAPYQSLATSQTSGGPGATLVTGVASRTTHLSCPTTVITPESLFILDFKAARALGISDFRDRLANKHPEVLRYCPDTQDRDWLLQQKQVTPLNKNGRFFLLALDDVRKLIERNAFEHTAGGRSGELQGFKVTEMIYGKIQKLLKELTERQRATADGFESPKVPPSAGVVTAGRARISSLSSSHATLTALLSTPHATQPGSESGSSSSTVAASLEVGELKRS
ncbi:deoxynucleotidyltransferase terminal-interacting protein 1 isoform X1 [Anopheles stephensi]|uniref:deoxynucleotidyltransferase terminal-interacting protein 1 isoform X1 n=1 Tax=Anopheles stephensi TaxID=30069 RepID=UPI001658BC22|nr:deoxynucleotidyltransferase terminal-interacting protein 1 isoform X1 [Anopheles stephensi]